jgi:hypothetical protein
LPLSRECEEEESSHPDYVKAEAVEITAVRTGNYTFPGIGPVKLHAVVPRFLEAIVKWEKNRD